jgi:hypothetical protein
MAYVNDMVFPMGKPRHSELDLIRSAIIRTNHCDFWFGIEANFKKKRWANS